MSSSDAKFLVVGLYVHDDLLAHASRNFEGYELFNAFGDPGYRIMWNCIRDTYLTTGEKPTLLMLLERTPPMLESIDVIARRTANLQIADAVKTLSLFDGSEIIGREHTMKLLEAASRRAAKDKLLGINSLDEDTTPALIDHAEGVARMLKNVAPKQGVRKRPLAPEQRSLLLRATARWNWGIDYWDAAGLKWYKKEIHGLLGPTGGGKTVNVTNIATRQLKEFRNVMIALYEQALEEDVEQRILSNLAGVSMDELRDRNECDISQRVRDKIETVCAQYVDRLVVLDMIGEDAGNGGVEELKAQIAEEKRETGFEPDLLIIDWLGEMVMRYDGLGNSDAAYRRCCEKFMSELVQFKEDTGYAILVVHQTNTHAQSLSPASKPNKTMAHEFRSFANKCDTCCVLGTMDRDEQVCWFVPDKSRRSNAPDRIIKLDGAYMRFSDATDEYEPMNNRFVTRAAAQAVRDELEEQIQRDNTNYMGA